VGALPEVRRRRASAEEAPGLSEELMREARAMKRRRARHETTPFEGWARWSSATAFPA
jgi:hypothetical protein